MDGLIAPLRFILKMFNRGDSTRDRTIRTGDIKDNVGTVNFDQSNTQTINVNPISETDGKRRREEAADGVWKAFLELKNNTITALFILDLAHPNNDLGNLGKNHHFAAALADLKKRDTTEYLEPMTNAEKYKPYVSDRLWNLLDAYKVFSLRPAVLLIHGSTTEHPANRWWEDVIIKGTIARDHMPEGLEQLAYSDVMPP